MIIILERGVWWRPPLIIFYFDFLPLKYQENFAPGLDKHGYQTLYKRKSNEVGDEFICIMKVGSKIHLVAHLQVYTGSIHTIATFFQRERFLHVKKMR